MEAYSVVLLLCSLVALGSACCTPDQWEGEEVILNAYADRRRHGLVQEGIAVAYDAVNNRTAAFVELRDGRFSRRLKVITRYDGDSSEGKLYVVDFKKDKCWTKTLRRPFRRACIPPDAQTFGNYSLGLKDGFNVTGYKINGRKFTAIVSVEEVAGECVPVGEVIYGRVKNVDFFQNIGFINIVRGIKNETVFDVPKECKQSEDASLPVELTRDHYILAI